MRINCSAIYCSVIISLHLMLMLPLLVSSDDWSASCASNCTCKWTNGKKSAICSSLQLTTIPTTLSTELQVLVLNDNHIQYLNREEFTNLGLLNLQRVYLKKSEVQHIHKETFKNLKILVEIDLSDNKIEMLDKDTFGGNDRLRILYLNGNPLKKLVAYQFPILPHLRTLDLHDCLISYIDPMALANLNMLEFLYLKNNLLESLSEYVFQHMTNLKTISLDDNPWQCNCKLRKFRNWYVNSKLNSVSLMCKGPPAQKDKFWERVEEEQYGCAPKVEIFNNEDVHNVEIGTNTTFGCLVYGDPLPEVSWALNGKILDNDNVLFDTETISSDKLWSNLTVFNMTSLDAGTYVCSGANVVGVASQNISIYLTEIVQHVLVKTPETFWYFGLVMGTFGTATLLVLLSFVICLCKRHSCQGRRHSGKSGVKASVSFNDQEKKLLDLSITTTADQNDRCMLDNNTTGSVATMSKAESIIGFEPIEIHTGGSMDNHGRNSMATWGLHHQKQHQPHHAHLTAMPAIIPNGCPQILTAPDGSCSVVGIPTSMASSMVANANHSQQVSEEFPLNVGVFPPPPEFCSTMLPNPAYGNIFISVSVTQDMLDGTDLNMYPDLLNIPKRVNDNTSSALVATSAAPTITTTTAGSAMSPITVSGTNVASFATLPRNVQRRGILKKDSTLQYQKQQKQQQKLQQNNLYPHDEIVSYHNLDTSYSRGYQEYQQQMATNLSGLPPPPPPPQCHLNKATVNTINGPPSLCGTPPLDGTPLRPLCNTTAVGSVCLKYDNMGRRITASGNSTLSLPDEERLENETYFNETSNQLKNTSKTAPTTTTTTGAAGDTTTTTNGIEEPPKLSLDNCVAKNVEFVSL